MPNLTQTHMVVKDTQHLKPVPDHDLVVYKIDGGARIYQATQPAGEAFKLKIWESTRSFKGYAVNKDPNLRFEEETRVNMTDGIHWFTLLLVVEYRVINSRQLVEKLASDPLERLRKEVLSVVAGGAAHLAWDDIKTESRRFHDLVRDSQTVDSGHMYTKFDMLQNYSAELGFRLNAIHLGRRIPPDFLLNEKKRFESKTEEAIKELETEVAINDLERQDRIDLKKHELEMRGLKRDEEENREKHRISIDGQEDRSAINAWRRGEKLKDEFAEDARIGVDRAVESIDNFRDLENAAGTMTRIGNSFVAPSSPGPALASGGESELRALTAAAEDAIQPGSVGIAGKLLLQGFSNIQSLSGDRRAFLAAFLHTVAETMLQEDADEAALQTYARQLGRHVGTARTVLERDQIEFFQKIVDREAMREYFA
ncbi:hypothetical protein SCOR_05335 [Sulfidibacter corallicola]